MTVYAYSRVSAADQDPQNQVIEIMTWGHRNQVVINEFVSEVISSRKSDREIFSLIDKLKKRDIIVCTELSRLSRGGIGATFEIIQKIKAKGAEIVAIRDNIDTRGGEFGSLTAEILIAVMSIAHRIERDKISERTKAGLEAVRRSGTKLGRKPLAEGGKTSSKLEAHHGYIVAAIEGGVAAAKVARKLGCSRLTVSRYAKTRGIKAKDEDSP